MPETPSGWPLPEQTTQPPDVVKWLTDGLTAADATLSSLGLSGRRVRFGSSVCAVSASGSAPVVFGGTFSANPVVLAVLGDEAPQIGYIQLVGSGVTTTGFTARVLTRSGAPLTSGTVRINWIAIGSA